MSTNRLRTASRERATPVRFPPFSFVDSDEREIELAVYGEHLAVDEFEPLVGLYGSFDPADRTLGLPPAGGSRIREWLRTLLDGRNVLAWHDDAVAGHAVLVEIKSGVYELGTFIHRAYQRSGIGSQLVTSLLDYGKQNGVERVRLTVERTGLTALTRYRKTGFTPTTPRAFAVEMTQEL